MQSSSAAARIIFFIKLMLLSMGENVFFFVIVKKSEKFVSIKQLLSVKNFAGFLFILFTGLRTQKSCTLIS
ncbi:hypothetical protein B9K06_07500 [Bacillus sp. OG2]|nr:hypothetical protein B9K06_07500 [Bacillus sp. OG2]